MNRPKTTYYYLHMLLMLMAWLTVTACNDDDALQEPAEYLNISIYSPQPETRAGTATHDPVTAETEENKIHDVHVWAFLSGGTDTDKPVGYTAGTINAASGNIQMAITQDNLNKLLASSGNVDFYVIANTRDMKSFLLPDGLNATRAQVRDASFGNTGTNDDFGGSTSTNAHTWYTSNLSGSGLPSANMKTENVLVTSSSTTSTKELTKGMISIQLLRAVSRVRFVFARATDLDDVEIKSIVISSADGIYKQEKLFYTSEETTSLTGDTETWSIEHDWTSSATPATPNECNDLTSLKRGDSETAQAYETRINTAISNNQATEYGRTYIRETNAPLTATITYICEQTTLTKTITLNNLQDPTSTTQHSTSLPRNHTWLVYGYFDKGSLELTATAQPWDLYEGTVSYEEDMVTVTNKIKWTDNTYGYLDGNSSSGELVFITDQEGGEAVIEGKFTFDAPRPAVWHASLIHQKGNEDAIMFVTTDDDGNETYSSTVSGPVGKEGTIRIHTTNNKTTVDNCVQLKFSIRRTLNNENISVEDGIIGERTYYINQLKNSI